MIRAANGSGAMTVGRSVKPLIPGVDPLGCQSSFTAVPEVLTISMLLPTVS